MGKVGDFRNSFLEILWITKNTVTTFWFWFPIIFMAYVLVQLWMMIYIHPLTLAIVPIILIIYGVRLEEKRIKIKYGIAKTKRLPVTHALGATPEPVKKYEWKVEQAVERYEQLLKDKKPENKKK
jgi:hypothetical protein